MCFSAQIWASYHQYVRKFGATLSIDEYVKLFEFRKKDSRVKVPKAVAADFAMAGGDQEPIRKLIDAFNAEQTSKIEQDLFKQKKRLADAERTLQTKVTKAATESQRIATDKISKDMTRLADIRRTELKDRDSRMFPGYYVPVMIIENGRKVVKPMRYQCRPAGKPAFYDTKYPGTYNARRDNLEGFWKGQFGHTHGIMVVNRFYENVSRHAMEGRELAEGEQDENIVLEFTPNPPHDMLVACLWSRWTAPGEDDLLSFAAITDEPPEEVRAAGHDRCIVPIKPENVEAWLNPDPKNISALYAILDDRDRPYYEHRLAA